MSFAIEYLCAALVAGLVWLRADWASAAAAFVLTLIGVDMLRSAAIRADRRVATIVHIDHHRARSAADPDCALCRDERGRS